MKKTFTLFLFLIATIALQLSWLRIFGWTPEFLIALLVAITIFVNLHEMALFVLLAAALVDWQPMLSMDMLALLLIPFFIFALRRASPWNIWAGTALFAILSVCIFYAAAGIPREVLGSRIFILNGLLSAALSIGFVFLLKVVGLRPERRLFAR